jgi:hypothetical protein
MFSSYELKVLDYIDRFTYLNNDLSRKKRRRFTEKDIKNGYMATYYYKDLHTTINIAKYLFNLTWQEK